MKKIVSMILGIVMILSLALSASADGIKVNVDLDSMSVEELLTLSEAIDAALQKKGYENSSEPKDSLEKDDDNTPETSTEEDSNEMVASMDEGATVLTDESFLTDMSSGLCARWAVPDEDTSIMSDKQLIQYFSKLVNSELVYVSKYSDYEFEDKTLGQYAHAYINALQSQFIGITEYKGKDENLYNQYWMTDGYYVRARYIYLINKTYGLEIPSEYNIAYKEMVNIGLLYNNVVPMEAAISAELEKVELSFDTSNSKYLYVQPFNITNTSPFDIAGLTIKINFINNDVVVDSGYLVSYENIASGKALSTSKVSTDDHFTQISYSYSFRVDTGTYYHDCEATINPTIQYSWDGKVKKDGELASGQAVLEVQNLTSGWELNTSWNKTLYVPVVKFDVVNTGTSDAETVTVKCVFTDNKTKQVWDEETSYVVSSSDTPLKAGYSKKAFIYSSVGYKIKLDSVPELTAEIYINGELVETIVVGKK